MTSLQPDQTNLINAQIAKLQDIAQSTEQALDALDALGTSVHTLRQTSQVALEEVNVVLTKFAKDTALVAHVPLNQYDEASYVYYINIEDDPLWGIDYDPRLDEDSGWSAGVGSKVEYLCHLHELGWMIRTAVRTPESLAALYKHRDWLGRCRAAGVDPYSPEGMSLWKSSAEREAAKEQERRETQRREREFVLRYALREAREEGLDCAAIIADVLARPVVSGISDDTHVEAPDNEEATDK